MISNKQRQARKDRARFHPKSANYAICNLRATVYTMRDQLITFLDNHAIAILIFMMVFSIYGVAGTLEFNEQ